MRVNDLLEFEAVADTSEATAGGEEVAAGADTATETGAAETAAVAAPTEAPAPAAQSFDPNDPQVRQALDNLVNEQLAPILQALQPQQEAPAPPDPWSDNYAEEMERYMAFQKGQWLAPYMPAIQAAENQQVNQWVDQQLGSAMQGYPDNSGDSDGDRQAVLYAAAGFRAQTGDDVQALQQAVSFQQARDAKIAAKAVADFKASINGAGPGGREPGVNGSAIGIESAPKSFDAVLSRWEGMTGA